VDFLETFHPPNYKQSECIRLTSESQVPLPSIPHKRRIEILTPVTLIPVAQQNRTGIFGTDQHLIELVKNGETTTLGRIRWLYVKSFMMNSEVVCSAFAFKDLEVKEIPQPEGARLGAKTSP
jgi:hypothetical protein